MNPTPPDSPPRESLLATLKSFPRPVWVLFVGVFLNKFGTFVVPFLTIYLTRRGFSATEAGLAIGAYGAGRIAAAVIGGHLADSIGRRRTIVTSMILAATSMLLLSQAESLTAIVLLTALASLTGEMYLPANTALLADLTPPHQRVTVYSTYRIAFNAGWAFGPAMAAFLAAHSFTWLFVGDALTSLLFAGIAWRWLPRGVKRSREAGWTEAVRTLRLDTGFLRVALATVLIGLVVHQLVSTYGLYLTGLGYSDVVYGTLLSFNGLLVMVCDLPLTRITRLHPPRVMMALGYLLIGAGVVLNVAFQSVPALFMGMLVITLGEMTFAPVVGAHVANLAPANMRGRYMGAWGMSNSLAMTLAPSLGMLLFAWHASALWLACGVVATLAAVTILAGPRRSADAALPTRELCSVRNTIREGAVRGATNDVPYGT